jgi:hypothetical protein
MIFNDSEFKRTLARLAELRRAVAVRREDLRRSSFVDERADRELCNLKANCQSLEDEVSLYESRIARTWVPA